jgi:circadian clock protein KaiB
MQEVDKIEDNFTFQLFIVGSSRINTVAVKNCKTILEDNLKGRYSLEIFDISQNPTLAQKENIIATPILIMKNPISGIRMIGDFSDTQKFLKKFFIL